MIQRASGLNWLPALGILNIGLIIITLLSRTSLGWTPLQTFNIFFFATLFGLVLGIIGLIVLIVGVFKKKKPLLIAGNSTLLLGVLPLVASILVVGPSRIALPLIHDISTDLVNPPEFTNARLLRSADENSLNYGGESVAAQQRETYPDIQPLLMGLTVNEALIRATDTVKALGWTITTADRDGNIVKLEAYAKTRLFGFIDDIVIRISPNPDGSIIDIRSVSRVGEGDLGANAERIRKFFNEFKKAGSY